MTDAASAERAECIMLNKGPYLAQALDLGDLDLGDLDLGDLADLEPEWVAPVDLALVQVDLDRAGQVPMAAVPLPARQETVRAIVVNNRSSRNAGIVVPLDANS